MAKKDLVGRGRFAGLTQGAANLAAAAERYGAEWGGGLGRKVQDAAQRALEDYNVGAKMQGEGLMAVHGVHPRQNPFARKLMASPYTALGLGPAAYEVGEV